MNTDNNKVTDIFALWRFLENPKCMVDPVLGEDLIRKSWAEANLGGYTEGARVHNSANISITPSGTWFPLTFDSERYDTDSIHDTSSNTDRLTCQTEGKYSIMGNVEFEANNVGFREVAISLNGNVGTGTTIAKCNDNPGVAAARAFVITTTYYLTVGDYVLLCVRQTSGGALNVLASGNYSPEFMISRVG